MVDGKFAVLTIALALGANAAIFSLVDGILLKSVGYPEPERIVQLWEKPPGGMRNGIAPANYIDWTKQSQSFEAMAAQTGVAMSYLPKESGGAPISLRVGVVSAPYFDVFGVKPALGRTFAPDEDQRGKEKVTVLTHRAWLSLMGGDSGVVGRSILLNGESYTVIGLLPGASEFDRRRFRRRLETSRDKPADEPCCKPLFPPTTDSTRTWSRLHLPLTCTAVLDYRL